MLVSGLTAIAGPLQWLAAICGWVGIVYVMLGGYFSWTCLPVRCSISIS